jgi:hypothetical protein
MTRNEGRLRGNGTSPLFQFWTTVRLRVFLRVAAAKADISQSEFVRLATWQRITDTLTEHEYKRCERMAAREATEDPPPRGKQKDRT